jgi:iron complex transport system ATP-binding protein
MAEAQLRSASVTLDGKCILNSVNLAISAGELVVLVGANGAGKTTLLRATLGLIPLAEGEATIDGEPSAGLKPATRARKVAYLPQMRPLAWPVSVRDVAALGRFAYGVGTAPLRGADAAAVERALAASGLDQLAGRRTDTLSGGELARVHVARALAAEAPLLLADEPTASLDPLHAWKVMEVVSRFVRDGGAALVAIHDLTLAARFATRIAVLKTGRLIADGPPEAVFNAGTMNDAYGVRMDVGVLNGALVAAVAGTV